MKFKLIFSGIVFLAVSILSCFVCAWLIIPALILEILFIINIVAGRLISKKVPGPFTTKKRNCDFIILGGSCMHKYMQNKDTNDVFDLSFYRRGLLADYLILNRFYSFGNTNATVVLGLDPSTDFTKKRVLSLTPYDLACLHKVTLAEINELSASRKIHNPLFFAPLFTVEMLLGVFCKKIIVRKKERCSQEGYVVFSEIFEKLINFCKQRGLALKIVIPNVHKETFFFKKLKDDFSGENILWPKDDA